MSLIRRHSKDYNFVADPKTGTTFRWGRTLNDNPFMAPIPELVDISISNHCSKGCSYCYRDSTSNNYFMSLEDYELVIKSLYNEKWGNVFQIALGGGEPLEHPNFIEILNITRDYNIVPNFTTNGLHVTNKIAIKIKNLIGAAAISYADINSIPYSTANYFIEEGIKTNIHFILDKFSIKQGIEILTGKYNIILKGFNAIIFLTYKPMGRGSKNLCLELNDDLINFCNQIHRNSCNISVGFDSCFMPLLMHFSCANINFIEPCECAFFSAYIDEKLNVKPCSFANNDNYTFNLRDKSFNEIWTGCWEKYRNLQINTCKRDCKNFINCRGGCPYYSLINLCKSEKTLQCLT